MSIEARPAVAPRFSPVTKNFLANLTGSGWAALTGIVCTPLYIHFLGMEAYGLVGFYFTLQGVIQILDLGLSPTMNREMARYSVTPEKSGEARDFVRTLEIGYWAAGVLIGITVWSAAPFLARFWIQGGKIHPEEILRAVRIMGVLTALQWPLTFYQGGLLGLQRQLLINGISISTATLGGGGAILILWLVSPTVTAFFTWQIAVSLLQTGLTTAALWRCLPAAGRPGRVDAGLLKNIRMFAVGMSGITLTTLVLTQLDRVILSKVLPLKAFGYYVLAGMVGNGLSTLLVSPMFNTVFPRFSYLVAANDEKSLREIYHGATQTMSVLILPAASVIALFSREIMLLWTGNAEIAGNTSLVVSLLVAGTALNGLITLPFALQLSYGTTRIGLALNAVFILIMVPAILFAAARFGAVGAASVWVMLNGLYIVADVPLTHRYFLKGESFRWFAKGVGVPLAGTLVVAGPARLILYGHEPSSRLLSGLLLLTVASLAAASSAMVTRATRDFLLRDVMKRMSLRNRGGVS